MKLHKNLKVISLKPVKPLYCSVVVILFANKEVSMCMPRM